jgi:hypothetical protein
MTSIESNEVHCGQMTQHEPHQWVRNGTHFECGGTTEDASTLLRPNLAPKADDPTLWTRPNEVQLAIVHPEAGICKKCGKPLTNAWFAWNYRITHPMYRPGDWKLGEDAFQCMRHTDGSPMCANFGACEYPKAQCKCGAYESFELEQLPYGDRTTCTVCGDSNYYSIGD